MKRLLFLLGLVAALAPGARADHIWINEFHYDNPGTDVNEFIEVAVRSGTPFNAADFSIVLYNGSNGQTYDTARPLTTFTASAAFSIVNSSETVTFYSLAISGIQNGSPDGIALVNTVTGTVVEFLSYEGTFTASNGPAAGLTSVDVDVVEPGSTNDTSVSRVGAGTGMGDFSFALTTQTPGQPNIDQTFSEPVMVTRTLASGAGYRLLSAPVLNVTVGTLAELNLVQSVVGQYPDYPGDILFIDHDGSLIAAADTAQAVEPARGFFWYLYDVDLDPDDTVFGGGSSQSYTLATRPLDVTGPSVGAATTETFDVTSNGFYMTGNPFTGTFALSGLTQTDGGGLFGAFVQFYDPQAGYQPVDRTTGSALVWDGFFAEVQGATGPVTFSYSALPAPPPPPPPPLLRLALDGTLDVDGTPTATVDRAAVLAVGATDAWDARDASKLVPPTDAHALVALVGSRDGSATRQAVLSVADAAVTTTDVAFTATHAGAFTLGAEVPAGWSARLVDRATGQTADLAAGAYAFTAEAGTWANRFELTVSSSVVATGDAPQTGLSVGDVYPNPTTGSAAFRVRTDAAQQVTATVLDALGRTVATVLDAPLAAGAEQTVSLPAGLAPGTYVVRVAGGSFVETRRLAVVR